MPCYLVEYDGLATYDFIANTAVPVFVIIFANTGLIYRVIRQKRRHRAAWRRHVKLTRQLLAIASMYTIFWFPLTINGLIITFLPQPNLISIQVNYFFFLLHLIPLLLPFISLLSLSNFREVIFKKHRIAIPPATNRVSVL